SRDLLLRRREVSVGHDAGRPKIGHSTLIALCVARKRHLTSIWGRFGIAGGIRVKNSCESLGAMIDCDVPPNDFARLPASRAFFFIIQTSALGQRPIRADNRSATSRPDDTARIRRAPIARGAVFQRQSPAAAK